jgi:hypothetical protein
VSIKSNKIEVVVEFIETISDEITDRFGNPSVKDLVYHLSEKGLVEPHRLRNYMMIVDFDKLLVENEGRVMHTFMDLSIKYDVSERQAQTIVYTYREKFKAKKNFDV